MVRKPSVLKDNWKSSAKPKRKSPPPFSIRFTEEERARLNRDAGALSLAAYIRVKLFCEEDSPPPRKKLTRKGHSPTTELAILGQLLGRLGNSEIAASMSDIASAAKHAKRIGKDARAIKTAIQDAWAISDSKAAFVHALNERGYRLARGDSAAFVAVDTKGETHAIARSLPPGIKTKHVRQRIGDEANLPSVGDVKKQIADDMLSTMKRFQSDVDKQTETRRIEFERRRKALVMRQRAERRNLAEAQARKQSEESRARQARFRKGFKGIWDRVRGEHRRIREENERQAATAQIRDQQQKEALIQAQLSQRRKLYDFRKLPGFWIRKLLRGIFSNHG